MEISLEDFNALSAERSRRDVQIAKLEMELQSNQRRHDEEVSALRSERNALWAENAALRQKADALQTAYENVRFENHWMKQYILLSVDRVQMFLPKWQNFLHFCIFAFLHLVICDFNALPRTFSNREDAS